MMRNLAVLVFLLSAVVACDGGDKAPKQDESAPVEQRNDGITDKVSDEVKKSEDAVVEIYGDAKDTAVDAIDSAKDTA
ncbi:MAG: hypothetical protein GY744_09065, partial [Gammaproteobacteria bacterium]|nr:hypothetical protein [Gammaproteobacteria bacterium]